ncbi:MAG: PqqD family protein [Planctomycetes bacterium]|nr:PqqD family protein [Planctomycetota bacterium]
MMSSNLPDKKPARKKRKPSFNEQLAAVPVRNERAIVIEATDQSLILGVDLKYTGIQKLFSKILKSKSRKKYQLDGLSLEMYHQIDGTRTVEELIDGLMERYKLTFFESRALINQYLQMLVKRGLVVLVV